MWIRARVRGGRGPEVLLFLLLLLLLLSHTCRSDKRRIIPGRPAFTSTGGCFGRHSGGQRGLQRSDARVDLAQLQQFFSAAGLRRQVA